MEDLGYGAVWMGAEQELALPSFHLRGKQGAKLRLAINHARTMHCHARELFPLSSPADAQAIAAVEAAWKAPRKALQTDSFLRTAPLEYAELRRYFGVETHGPDQDASLQTLVVCSPVSRRAAYLQDFLRRPEAPRGAMEMAAVAAFEGLRRDGVSSATMGIVPFFGPSHAESIGFTGRLAQQCIRRFVYRFEGLQQFRAKFTASRVEPVYALHYPRSVSLLAIWDLVTSLAPRANQAKRTKPAGQGVTEPA
ncbi:hypothetical protein AKJ09_03344 [Labilithrix luteola]|uniref:Phosphatidylglycerol lysyltransferase C-terminal domain-containing protein n=1 Tax=Labilithrix luteola TaxID=1391654 RepID=A0A0K1PT08_9BACT|nr:hypothetical protein AKJ09_03344 [Labilithrix luteola]